MIDEAGWDVHAHLFGPYARYPLASQPSHSPPEATQAHYLALLARLGLRHGVLVQPSAYGPDHSLLLDALAAQPALLRGVVVARPGYFDKLQGLRALGVRSARFSHRSGGANFAGSATFDDLMHLAPTLADAGLHAELWTDCAALPSIASRLRTLPVPLVIDHMGGFDVAAGVDEPGFRSLLSLLETGHVWIKLCAYRNLLSVPELDAGRPFHVALVRAQPQRLLWGSDWPHLRVKPVPDAEQLLQLFRRWTDSEALSRQILQSNPVALYG